MRYLVEPEEISEYDDGKWKKRFCYKVSDLLSKGFVPLGAPFICGDFINQGLWKPARQKSGAPSKQPLTAAVINTAE